MAQNRSSLSLILNLIMNNQKNTTIVIELCVIMLGWHINALLQFRKHFFSI